MVNWSPEASLQVQEMEGVAESEEGEENKVDEGSELAQEDKAEEAEGVDSSPVESMVTITRHPQKNTFGIRFEATAYLQVLVLVWGTVAPL